MSYQENIEFACHMCVSAIAGRTIFNHREFSVEHQHVFDALLGTSYEWLHKLVMNLAYPNIDQFSKLLDSSREQLEDFMSRTTKNGKPVPEKEKVKIDDKMIKTLAEKVRFKVLYDEVEQM